MGSTRIKQLTLVAVVCGLIAFLYFNNRNTSTALTSQNRSQATGTDLPTGNAASGRGPQEAASASGAKASSTPFDFVHYQQDELKRLKAQLPAGFEQKIETLSKQSDSDTAAARDIGRTWDKLERPVLSGWYYKKIADKTPRNAWNWFLVGKRYFDGQAFLANSAAMPYFVDESMAAYEKALAIDPKNLDAKADLAANIIEGKSEPMKGIGLLREIIQTDSLNRKALLYLGVFSMQSKQFDRAIARFRKLTEIDPSNADYHRLLAEADMEAGKKDEARKEFKVYKGMVRDPRLLADVNRILTSLQ